MFDSSSVLSEPTNPLAKQIYGTKFGMLLSAQTFLLHMNKEKIKKTAYPKRTSMPAF